MVIAVEIPEPSSSSSNADAPPKNVNEQTLFYSQQHRPFQARLLLATTMTYNHMIKLWKRKIAVDPLPLVGMA